MPCSCPVCTGLFPRGPGRYPYPVRIVLPNDPDVAYWGWLTKNTETEVVVHVRDKIGRGYTKRTGARSIVKYVINRHYGNNGDVAPHVARLCIFAVVEGKRVTLDKLPNGFSDAPPPLDASADATCHEGLVEDEGAAVEQSPAQRPRTSRASSRATRAQKPPPPRPASPSVMEARPAPVAAAYALHDLGGDTAQVHEIHAQSGGKWNADVAEAMALRAHAQLRIHDATRLVASDRGACVECVVVAPDGSLVGGVVLPLVYVKVHAPDLARHVA